VFLTPRSQQTSNQENKQHAELENKRK